MEERSATTVAVPQLPALDAFEIATGTILGQRRSGVARVLSGDGDPAHHVRDVLDELLLAAVTHQPCVVAFSGGRDSSALLARTVHTARRHGLPDPVPLTLRFAAHGRTDETTYQEEVVRSLELSNWEVVPISAELDAVGVLAGSIMRRHGLFWPPNAQTCVPMLGPAKGGTLVTGVGGDEVLSPWGERRAYLIRRMRLAPSMQELKYLPVSLLPAFVRERAYRVRPRFSLPWLTSEGNRRFQHSWAADLAHAHRSWRQTLERFLNSRYLELSTAIFDRLARERDVEHVTPFLDPRFITAMTAAAPREGFASRREALDLVAGDVLPSEVLNRTTKAVFTEVFRHSASRRFAEEWNGTAGVDLDLADERALRAAWMRDPSPDFRSLTALQSAWLASSQP